MPYTSRRSQDVRKQRNLKDKQYSWKEDPCAQRTTGSRRAKSHLRLVIAASASWSHDQLEAQFSIEGAERNGKSLQCGSDGRVVVQDVDVGADLPELHHDLQHKVPVSGKPAEMTAHT